ncbi:MAG: DUF3426 domain-containing protein [Syntrophales bacterium]
MVIIICEKCHTRFRFEESTIPVGGAWFRCSRCEHVFFEKSIRSSVTSAAQGAAEASVSESPQARQTAPIVKPEVTVGPSAEEQNILRPSPVKGIQPWKAALLLLVIALLAAALGPVWYFSMNPNAARAVMNALRSTPVIGFLIKHSIPEESGPAYVKLTQLQQRYVGNWLVGNVRVLEGQALNTSKYPMTRIQIRAELLDGGGNVLAAQTAYSGNVLTDTELAGLSDMEMQKKLSLPQGSTVSNDRIEPGGEVPFMIVFANEPLGVTRTVCLPNAAERLLP